MKKTRLITTLYCLGLLLAMGLPAKAQTNLLNDGPMEVQAEVGGVKIDEPYNWYFPSAFRTNVLELKAEHKRPSSPGTRGILATPVEDAYELCNSGGSPSEGRENFRMQLEPNTKYKYSFWVKTRHGRGRLLPKIKFGRRPWSPSRTNDPIALGDTLQPTTSWQEITGEFTTPSHDEVKYSQFVFSLEDGIWEKADGSYDMEYYYFDDAMLYLASEQEEPETPQAPVATLTKPAFLSAVEYQRELEISWRSETPEGITWEIVVNDAEPIKVTDQLKYTLTQLQAATEYKVKVRATKGEEFSEWVEKTFSTKKIELPEDSPRRAPYIRDISTYGNVGTVVPLYFEDLYGENPTIEVYIDGKKTEIKDNAIHFEWKQPAGENYQNHTLEIIVKESDTRSFRLTYYLRVEKPRG